MNEFMDRNVVIRNLAFRVTVVLRGIPKDSLDNIVIDDVSILNIYCNYGDDLLAIIRETFTKCSYMSKLESMKIKHILPIKPCQGCVYGELGQTPHEGKHGCLSTSPCSSCGSLQATL